MSVSLHTFIDLFDRSLATASHLLDKGVEYAELQGIDPAELLRWRLIGDMHPLAFQLMVVVNFSRQWPARVAGLPVPDGISADLDVAGFKAAFDEARSYLAALPAEQLEARAEIPLTVRITDDLEPTLPGERWLSVFATTNIYFHLSTAYGILRSMGVPLGKPDMFAGGL